MPWKINSSAAFTGGSGQMAVMGELLDRRCNAAVPHVDIGMDVFAFRDDREEVARIQVKTARGHRYKNGQGFYADFRIPMKQLVRTDDPQLFYALAIRLENGWGSFLVIGRRQLRELWSSGCGSEYQSGDFGLYVRFRPNDQGNLRALCGSDPQFDLSEYVNAWESLPPFKPVAAFDVEPSQA